MCAPLLGADSSIRVTTTTNVVEGTMYIDEVFTRSGQTNLTRRTGIESGQVTTRLHYFFHDGLWLASMVWTAPPRSDSIGSDFTVHPGFSYFVKCEFGSSNQITSASIFKRDAVIDSFSCTNGLFFPDDASRIAKANEKRKKK